MLLQRLRKLFTPDNPDIAIFSEGAMYAKTFMPLVKELCRRNLPCAYLTLDRNDPVLNGKHPCLQGSYVGKGAIGFARVATQKARVMLSTTPNIGCPGYPLPRPKRVGCLAHVYHSVDDPTYYKKGALDYFDATLDVGDWCAVATRKLERLRGLPPKECVPVGLLYMDELARQVQAKEGVGNPPCLLYAPSWGARSSLAIHGLRVIHDLLACQFRLIVRPHPQSWHFDKEIMEQVRNLADQTGSFVLDTDLDGTKSMSVADVLVSDTSAVRFDFAFLYKRPVITLQVPETCMESYEAADVGGPWDVAITPMLGAVIAPGERPDWKSLVSRLVSMPPSHFANLYDQYVVNHGTAARAVVDWLEDKLGRS